MSCWVVPLIAADYLKVSVEEIQARIKAGTIPTFVENGFTFVDVLPHLDNLHLPMPRKGYTPTPPTFEVVSREEMIALTEPLEIGDDPAPAGGGFSESPAGEFSWSRPRALAKQRRIAPRQAA